LHWYSNYSSDLMTSARKRKLKRHCWSRKEKIEMVECANDNSVASVLEKWQVDKSLIYKWMKLYNLAEDAIGDSTGRKRRGQNGKPIMNQKIEDFAIKLWTSYRSKGLAIPSVDLQERTRKYSKLLGIKFAGSNGWAEKFIARHELSTRYKTSCQQKIPEDYAKQVLEFQNLYFRTIIAAKIEDPERIANMDETPICFDMPHKTTLEKKGKKTVEIKTNGKHRRRFTLALCATVSGNKLRPMAIFKGTKPELVPKVIIPNGIVGRKNPSAWMNKKMMLLWISTVLKPWKIQTFGINDTKNCILLLDSAKTHKTEDVEIALLLINVIPIYIPAGLTSILQPLDISVNRSFKCNLRKIWSTSFGNIVLKEEKEVETYDEPHYETVKKEHDQTTILALVVKTWSEISQTIVLNGFEKAGLLLKPG